MAKYKILRQKVFHDGTSMIVLKPETTKEIPDRYVGTFRDEGVIGDKPVTAAAKTSSPRSSRTRRTARSRAATKAPAPPPTPTPSGGGAGAPPAE